MTLAPFCSAVLITAVLTACSSLPSEPPDRSTSLHGAGSANQGVSPHPHPITKTPWHLDHTTTGATQPLWQGAEHTRLQLKFHADEVRLSGLCNEMAASYVLDGNQIRFGQVTSTMRICTDDTLMQTEQAIGLHFPKARTWAMPTTSTLRITFDDGTIWTFYGGETNE